MENTLSERLRDRADDAECAAHIEAIVIDGLLTFRENFNDGDHSPHVMRRLRVLLDAEKDFRRFKIEAVDFRAAADAVEKPT